MGVYALVASTEAPVHHVLIEEPGELGDGEISNDQLRALVPVDKVGWYRLYTRHAVYVGPELFTDKNVDPDWQKGEGGLFTGSVAGPADPEVINVGGDTWNKETAVRLEHQYQRAKPDIERTLREVTARNPMLVVPPFGRWNPLHGPSGYGEPHGEHDLAHALADTRAFERITKAGITTTAYAVRRADGKIWAGWVDDGSHSLNGMLVQVAASEALGGRLRIPTRFASVGVDFIKKFADEQYPEIGGYAGVKEMIKAKWETTQYILDSSGIDTLTLFRGLSIPGIDQHSEMTGFPGATSITERIGSNYRLTDWDMQRAGVQSTSVSSNVANSWDGNRDRVVVRMEIPRTAALTLPVYGENEMNEQEIVVAGTAWSRWDAWHRSAPDLWAVDWEGNLNTAREAAFEALKVRTEGGGDWVSKPPAYEDASQEVNRIVPGKRLVINLGFADADNPGGKHWLHPDVRLSLKDKNLDPNWTKGPDGKFTGSLPGEGEPENSPAALKAKVTAQMAAAATTQVALPPRPEASSEQAYPVRFEPDPNPAAKSVRVLSGELIIGQAEVQPTGQVIFTSAGKGYSGSATTARWETMKSGEKLYFNTREEMFKSLSSPAEANFGPTPIPPGVVEIKPVSGTEWKQGYANVYIGGKLAGEAAILEGQSAGKVLYTHAATGQKQVYGSAEHMTATLSTGNLIPNFYNAVETEAASDPALGVHVYVTKPGGKRELVGTAKAIEKDGKFSHILFKHLGGGHSDYFSSWTSLETSLGADPKLVGINKVDFKTAGTEGIWTVSVNNQAVGTAEWTGGGVRFVPSSGRYAETNYQSWEALKREFSGAPDPDIVIHDPPAYLVQAAAAVPLASLDEKLTRTDGSGWNQETAIRLAKEHAALKPAIEASIAKVTGTMGRAPLGSWHELTLNEQDIIEAHWHEHYKSDFIDDQTKDWKENLAPAESMMNVAYDADRAWAIEAIQEHLDERAEMGDVPVRWTAEQLNDALLIDATPTEPGKARIDFTWNDDALDTPIGYDPDQLWMPGMEGPAPSEFLTPATRASIETKLDSKLREIAADKVEDMEVPDFIERHAHENLDETWDELSKEDKYGWGIDHGYINREPGKESRVFMPEHPDPLNDRNDDNYRETQRISKSLGIERARAVMAERGIANDFSDDQLAAMDAQLWVGWISSSTSTDGQLLQMLAADELGGRLNEDRVEGGGGREKLMRYADRSFKEFGGYEGLKAYIRGKWETTQALLEAAGVNELHVYRAIHDGGNTLIPGGYPPNTKLPTDTQIKRNGLASFSMDPSIVNKWGSPASRVVIRATIPRTAVLSVPSFGVNTKSEHEVIIAGTGWTGWDAWHGNADTFNESPMQLQRGTAEEEQAWRVRKEAVA